MTPVKTIVVGVGHLGKIHARLASEAPHIDLLAVVDSAQDTAAKVAFEFGTKPASSIDPLLDECEAAIVATPTVAHHAVCDKLLSAGKHVLVEKPITHTVEEADRLIETARNNSCVLQVGHVERFNPALEAALPHVHDPRYLRGCRASGFTFRSTDIGVVMDLMIHDIDIVLSLASSEVIDVSAFGMGVMGDQEDIAHAELTFANGCVAHLVASRVSYEQSRSLQVYGNSGFASVDFANRQATVVHPREDLLRRQFDLSKLAADEVVDYRNNLFETLLVKESLEPEASNAIAEEQRDFATAIREGHSVRVTGQAGRDALEVAQRVLESIAAHDWDGVGSTRRGAAAMPMVPVVGGAEHWEPTSPVRKAG